MRTWALVSQKGGTGKSTLATQLGVYAEECGEAVLIADVDPQGSSLTWSRVRESREPLVVPAKAEDLTKLIKEAPRFGATLCLIDTPPHTDATAVAAIRAADLVICPTQPSLFDVAALKDTIALLDLCKARGKAVGVVNGVPHQKTLQAYKEAAAAVTGLGLRVCAHFVGHRRPYVVAIGQGKGVTEVSPKDKAALEVKDLWAELNKLSPIVMAKREAVDD